jgi:hypothetical protein
VVVVARMKFHLLQQPRGFAHAEPAGVGPPIHPC